MTGIAKQSSAPPQQGEIDSPGIYADRIDAAVFLGAAPQRCQHFRVKAQDVPVHGVERPHRSVGETVNDL